MVSIQRISHPQDSGKLLNHQPVRLRQGRKILMLQFRRRFAMVPGHLRHHRHLAGSKMLPSMLPDEASRFLVMPLPHVVEFMPDIVEMSGPFQEQAFPCPEAMKGCKPIKQLQRQAGHMRNMPRAVFEFPHQRQDFTTSLHFAHAGSITAPKRNPRVLTDTSAKPKCSITAS